MKIVRSLIAAAALLLGLGTAQAAAPPTPLPSSVLCDTCQKSLSVTSTSARTINPSTNPNLSALTLFNSGTKDAYFVQGDATATATASNVLLPAGRTVTVWVSGTYIAAITGGSDTTTILIYQAGGPLNLAAVGPQAGGTPGGAAGGDLSGTYPNPTVARINGSTPAAIATSGSASDLTTGTVPAARLPNPSASTLGGTQSIAVVANNFLTGVSTSGVPSQARPSCSSLSDAGSGCSGAASATGANPTATIGAAAVNGSAATFMRSDAAPALPSTLPNLNIGTPTGGVATNLTGTAPGLTAGNVTTNANLTGDVTSSGNATTLATVNAGPGSVGSSTAIPVLTTNGKGLVTAQTTAAVVAPAGTLTGGTLAAGVTASSLTSVGTLTGGGTGAGFTLGLGASTITGVLPAANGGAGTINAILRANGAGAVSAATNGTDYTLVTAQSCTNQVITAITAAGVASCSSVANAMLSNSTISGVALGSNLGTLTFGTHLISGGSSYNGSAGVTITSDAASANTPSTIVARDGSGNFTAGTITAALTGTASGNLVSGGALGTPSSGVGTNITNVNAATLGGATFASPGTIGGTSAGIVNSTTLNSTAGINLTTTGSVDTYVTLTRATQASGQIGWKLVSTTGGTSWFVYNPASSNSISWYNGVLGASAMNLDTGGNLTANGAYISGGTAPTLTGTCTTASQTGGNTAGTFTATCVAQTVIITFATTAPAGWKCTAGDQTTPADTLTQTANSTTSCTLQGTTVALDRIVFEARAF